MSNGCGTKWSTLNNSNSTGLSRLFTNIYWKAFGMVTTTTNLRLKQGLPKMPVKYKTGMTVVIPVSINFLYFSF